MKQLKIIVVVSHTQLSKLMTVSYMLVNPSNPFITEKSLMLRKSMPRNQAFMRSGFESGEDLRLCLQLYSVKERIQLTLTVGGKQMPAFILKSSTKQNSSP